ncbi:MAG: hypothetical protein ABI876_05675, partial [Bacteroidota bacterium]
MSNSIYSFIESVTFPALTSVSLFLCWMAVASGTLCAQSIDIRLSNEIPLNAEVFPEGRIQSAGSIGSKTLVAWGTNRLFQRDTMLFSIRYQMLDGGNRVGADSFITSDDARPYGLVMVIPLHDRLLVLWNDLRGGIPGIYARRIALNGNIIGNEQRIGPGHITNGITRLLGNSAVPSILMFTEGTGYPFIIHIDSLGGIGEEPRTISAIRSNQPYCIYGDTSLATISGDTLRRFRSIFDSLPTSTALIPDLNSALPGTVALQNDTNGMLRIISSRMNVRALVDASDYIDIDFYRTRVYPTDSVTEPELAFHFHQMNGPVYNASRYQILHYRGSFIMEGCGEEYTVYFKWFSDTYIHAAFYSRDTTATYYSINPKGEIALFGSGTGDNCIPSARAVTRLQDSSAASVGVMLDSITVVLHALSA